MTNRQEIEYIDPNDAKEALNLLIAEGNYLWRTYSDDFGELMHWLVISHTALEPLPDYQERFRMLCGGQGRPAGARLSAGVYILGEALKKMHTNQVKLENPSLSYRRLLASIPD